MNINNKKAEVLGMPAGTAQNRLRKMLLFKYVCQAGDNICHQCNKEISNIEEFSIEHKIPWLKNGKEYFWDLNNIMFSHLSCNISAAEKVNKGISNARHGTITMYTAYKCRCELCKEASKLQKRKERINSGVAQ